MSTQGWAAGLSGLNTGLLQGLDIAAKRHAMSLEEAKLAQAAKERAAAADTQKFQFEREMALKERALEDSKNKDLVSNPFAPQQTELRPEQMGMGPTAIGASSGLGALAPPEAPKGLEFLSKLPAKVDKNILAAYKDVNKVGNDVLGGRPDIAQAISQAQPLNQEQISYLSKTPEGRSIFNSAQQAVNQSRTDARVRELSDENRQERINAKNETYAQKASDWVEKSGYNSMKQALVNLNQEMGLFGDKPDLSKLPGPVTTSLGNLWGVAGQAAAETYGGGRTNQLIRQLLDPELYKFSGSAVTTGEAARAQIRRGLGANDPNLVAQGLKDFYNALEMDARTKAAGNKPGFKSLRESGAFSFPSEDIEASTKPRFVVGQEFNTGNGILVRQSDGTWIPKK
jgi:hypothetical protein